MDGVPVQNVAVGEGLRDGAIEATLGRRAIWIASYPKSGNTWVRVFLHNLLRELREPDAASQDINALHEVTARESLAARFTRRLGKSAHEAAIREIAEARMRVQADMVQGRGGPVYIKTHNAIANVDGFPAINLAITLAVVYIVRNPLDVAVSYAHFLGMPYDEIIFGCLLSKWHLVTRLLGLGRAASRRRRRQLNTLLPLPDAQHRR